EAYRQSISRRIPLAIAVFLGSVTLSAVFEILRFPERRQWMLGFAAAFLLLSAMAWGAARRREEWIVPILVAFLAVIGISINAYHVIVHASVAMCIWVLTALLCSSALILPWGRRNQALACVAVLATYPAHVLVGNSDLLTWAAGGAYLLMVTGLST